MCFQEFKDSYFLFGWFSTAEPAFFMNMKNTYTVSDEKYWQTLPGARHTPPAVLKLWSRHKGVVWRRLKDESVLVIDPSKTT